MIHRALIAIALLASSALAQHAVDLQPLEVCTPQFTAVFDANHGRLDRLQFTLTADQLNQAAALHGDRDWWQHPALAHLTLEDSDYTGSGMDRGHVFALQWACGTDWEACNCTAFIVPQWPAANRGPIKSVEQHITDLTRLHGSATVEVTLHYSEEGPVRFPHADEDGYIPIAIEYRIAYDGREEQYLVPNVKAPASNKFEAYRVGE